jgi:hypothetical protein
MPALGEGIIATRLGDKPVFRGELLPQDLKLENPQLTREEAMATRSEITLLSRISGHLYGSVPGWHMTTSDYRRARSSSFLLIFERPGMFRRFPSA